MEERKKKGEEEKTQQSAINNNYGHGHGSQDTGMKNPSTRNKETKGKHNLETEREIKTEVGERDNLISYMKEEDATSMPSPIENRWWCSTVAVMGTALLSTTVSDTTLSNCV